MSLVHDFIEAAKRVGSASFTILVEDLEKIAAAVEGKETGAGLTALQAQLDAVTKQLADKTQQYGDLFAVNQTQANKIDVLSAQVVELSAEVDTLKLATNTAKPDAPTV